MRLLSVPSQLQSTVVVSLLFRCKYDASRQPQLVPYNPTRVIHCTTNLSCFFHNCVVIIVFMKKLDALVTIAKDLTAALNAKDRYMRLLEALGTVIPYDAAALHRLEGDALVPLAARGLSPEALSRRYVLKEHPRLRAICAAHEPVRFASDDPTPDPFDGLLAGHDLIWGRIKACMGCPLYAEDRLMGALTADAVEPNAFDGLDQGFLRAIGALAGAQMQTAELMEALERRAEQKGMIARDLMRDAERQRSWQLLGQSPVMEHLREEIRLVAPSDFTVLVMGETGVGKEMVVRAIHAASPRRDAPLLFLNCAALPETLAESELFGHTKGAFTGASRDRVGKLELATGGTLVLDEIGELPLPIQPKLLRAVQEKEIQPVGSNHTVRVDVRLLVMTNRNLKDEVQVGRFRADLFHRLNVYPIKVPPMRDRIEDVPLLTSHFAEMIRQRLNLGPVRISSSAIDVLCQYDWPGNVRELENVLCRAILKASSGVPRGEPVMVGPVHLGADLGAGLGWHSEPLLCGDSIPHRGQSLHDAVDDFRRRLIQGAVARNGGKWAAAARELGMHRSNLHNLAVRLGLRTKATRANS